MSYDESYEQYLKAWNQKQSLRGRPSVSPCNMSAGCCFCDKADYARCKHCGHLVCAEHEKEHES